uniref:SJCHGC09183 protein n=1 Tax=Schistosoma japonicum TaxID=6182 RepID=Q5DF62_SCHJA|nr:SJCHGC09183 protein [Schistosoma japonicum]
MVLRYFPVCVTLCRRVAAFAATPKDPCSVLSPLEQKFYPHIGNREIVGFGRNGVPMYYDDIAFPYPSIRFRNHTPEIAKLREKEQGEWGKLTEEEVKTLYRHSFQSTFAEMVAPHGQWKLGLAYGFIFISIGLVFYIYIRLLYHCKFMFENFTTASRHKLPIYQLSAWPNYQISIKKYNSLIKENSNYVEYGYQNGTQLRNYVHNITGYDQYRLQYVCKLFYMLSMSRSI